MPKISAGLLMYKINDNKLKVFLVHPGSPFWKDKDKNAWSIPKGEVEKDERLFDAAKREFFEETGVKPKSKSFIELGNIKQKSGKIVHAWAFEGDRLGLLKQNMIEVEFPFGSGKKIKVPEIDKAKFFGVEEAKEKINQAQFEFIERLKKELKVSQ
ncbi:MAG: NUDIX domain-containing protein [Nanoarchaeota archaeon]